MVSLLSLVPIVRGCSDRGCQSTLSGLPACMSARTDSRTAHALLRLLFNAWAVYASAPRCCGTLVVGPGAPLAYAWVYTERHADTYILI